MPKTPSIIARTPIFFASPFDGLERYFQLEALRIVRESGGEDDHIIWRRGDFVVVVAMTNDGRVVMIREYKQAIEQTVFGLPAGGIKKGESPIEAALRELRQETGYEGDPASALVLGDPLFNSPDKSTERHYIVLVQKATKGGPATPEESETILATHVMSADRAFAHLKIALHIGALALAVRSSWR